jgi:hypothetical protein
MKTVQSPASSVAPSSVAASSTPSAALERIPSVSAAEVAAFVSAIDTFSLLLGAGFVVPQPAVLKRMVKPRKTAPTIVPMVADLSTRYSVTSTAYPMAVTLAQQQLVNTLAPLAERIGAVQKLVSTVVSTGQSVAWEGAMVTYGLLKTEARGNAVLRNALLPVRDKLRPTYETEDGGTTRLRSRAKSVTPKKTSAATRAPSETPAAAEASVKPIAIANGSPSAAPTTATS